MLLEILLVITTLLAFFLWRTSRSWNYWSERGLYQLPNVFPFGSSFLTWGIMLGKEQMGDVAFRQFKVSVT